LQYGDFDGSLTESIEKLRSHLNQTTHGFEPSEMSIVERSRRSSFSYQGSPVQEAGQQMPGARQSLEPSIRQSARHGSIAAANSDDIAVPAHAHLTSSSSISSAITPVSSTPTAEMVILRPKRRRSSSNSESHPDQDIALADEFQPKKYFELCVNYGKWERRLGEIDITSIRTDGDLFRAIKDRYNSVRGHRAALYLLEPVDVRFVQVSRTSLLLQERDC